MAFNAYEYVKNIYDMKTGWHAADKAGDRNKANEYAKNAEQYYKLLIDNGYTDVADALKNTNDVGAKYIVDNFMKNNSAPVDTSKSSTPTATADLTKADGMETDLYGVQRTDKDTISKKYDTLEEYAYGNPFERDEGKSIMENYKFQGKTASDNAVADGGASNGGNIDSYAAANANRQQLAFTNAGTQAVLSANSEKINQLRGILSDMGVTLQNQYKSMQDTIGLKQTEEQRKFDNDVKTSEVTGYVPESMQNSNNPFFNKDGTLINPDTTDYSQIITNAKNKLKTTTDSAEKANLEATIKYATQARAHKILNMPEYSKWANTMELTSPDETLTSKVTNKELDNDKHAINTESETSKYISDNDLEGTKHTNNTNERISDKSNTTSITIADMNAKSAKEIAQLEAQAVEDVDWQDELKKFNLSEGAKTVLNVYAHDAWASSDNVEVEILPILAENIDKITEYDASEILRMYKISDDYIEKNSGGPKTKAEWLKQFDWYNPKEDD